MHIHIAYEYADIAYSVWFRRAFCVLSCQSPVDCKHLIDCNEISSWMFTFPSRLYTYDVRVHASMSMNA